MLGYWLYEGSSASFPLMEIASTLLSSLSLAFGGALLSCLLALPVSILVVRYPGALARWTQRLPYLLQALPGLVIALSLVYFSLHYLPATYQTTGLLLVAYALLFMPLTQAPIRVALEKASPQLEEAARTLGQTPLMAFLRITLPIISPAIGAGFVLVFLDTMKELTATLVLGPTGLSTLATSVWVHRQPGVRCRRTLRRAADPDLRLAGVPADHPGASQHSLTPTPQHACMSENAAYPGKRRFFADPTISGGRFPSEESSAPTPTIRHWPRSNRAKVCPGLAGSPICALFGVAKAMPPSISASIDSVRSDRPLNRLASTPKPLAFQKRLPVRTSGT